uniref:Multidrug-efflux transporter n=1 Tax=uncultured Thiotrichaceae bacterium TaxID=298394 RepID=A0A6S6ST16_9GAMM|nr:MAG: Unknown protein [uncultured Thiotrichaceae bacterium]
MSKSNPNNKDIFKLSWPIAMNAILLQLTLVIDTVLVTPLGEGSLAAMGLAASIAGLILGFLFAFSNGTQLLIAQAFGADKVSAMCSGFNAGLIINWAITFLGVLFILTFGKAFVSFVAETQVLADLAYEYLSIFSIAVFGVSISQHITAFFNATGNSKLPFYANILELPINVAVSLVLIHGMWGFPEMGLAGAALGTSIAVLCRSLFLITLLRRLKASPLKGNQLSHISLAGIRNHFKNALPIAATFVSMVLSNSLCMMIYARLGVLEFAALTLITPWIRVAGHLVTAWAQATGILVGQLLGRNAREYLDRFVSHSWRMAFVLSGVVSLCYLGMFFMFEWFYPELQQETIDTLWQFMPILVVVPFIRSSNTICGHVLRAGGDATHAFKIHFYAQWLVIVPLSALFVLYLDLHAVWVFGLILLEELVKSVPFHLRIYSGRWKRCLVEGDSA